MGVGESGVGSSRSIPFCVIIILLGTHVLKGLLLYCIYAFICISASIGMYVCMPCIQYAQCGACTVYACMSACIDLCSYHSPVQDLSHSVT